VGKIFFIVIVFSDFKTNNFFDYGDILNCNLRA
jgi:hypothetical protein